MFLLQWGYGLNGYAELFAFLFLLEPLAKKFRKLAWFYAKPFATFVPSVQITYFHDRMI